MELKYIPFSARGRRNKMIVEHQMELQKFKNDVCYLKVVVFR
jgi:hypothetical protein